MTGWDPKPGFDLAGKRALVVGFANPSGRAVALALAEAGADVATASATLEAEEILEAQRVSRAIGKQGRATFSQGWDVTLPTNVQVGLKQLEKEFGQPNVLVYNADAYLSKPLEKTTDAEFARVQQVNLSGAYYASRSFVRELGDSPAGRIIYLSSIFGERGLHTLSAYATAKAGLTGLTASLSQELGQRGITVNIIASGWMDWTPGRGEDDIGANRLLRFIPLRRFGQADDLAALAVLLASDGAAFLNGQTFHIDGGISQHL